MAKKNQPMANQPDWVLNPTPAKPLQDGQFQQMQIFHSKPNDTHRWPRGYTPARLHEMDAAVPRLSVGHLEDMFPKQVESGAYVGRRSVVTTRIKKARGYTAPLNEVDNRIVDGTADHFRHRLVEGLARSTVPAEDLGGLVKIGVGEPGHPFGPNPGAAGTAYSRREIRLASGLGFHRDNLASVALHEIGHTVDPDLNSPRGGYHTYFTNDQGRYEYLTPGGSTLPEGQEVPASTRGGYPSLEGYADGYKTRHFRGDPRSKFPRYTRDRLNHPGTSRAYDYVYGNNGINVPPHVLAEYHKGIMRGSEGDIPAPSNVTSPKQFWEQQLFDTGPTDYESDLRKYSRSFDSENGGRANLRVKLEAAEAKQNEALNLGQRQRKNQRRKRTTIIRADPIPPPRF